MIQYKPFLFLLNKGRKPSTIKRYVYDIEDFGHWLENKKLPSSNIWATLCTKDYEDYFSDLKRIDITQKNDASCIYCTK